MIVCLLHNEPGLDGVNNNLVVEFINFVGVAGEKTTQHDGMEEVFGADIV